MCTTSQQNRKPVSTAIKMYTFKSRDRGVGTLQLFCEPIQCGLCEDDFRDDHFISTNWGLLSSLSLVAYSYQSRGGTLGNPPLMLALLQSLFRPHVGSNIVEVLWMQFPCYFQGTQCHSRCHHLMALKIFLSLPLGGMLVTRRIKTKATDVRELGCTPGV